MPARVLRHLRADYGQIPVSRWSADTVDAGEYSVALLGRAQGLAQEALWERP